MADTIAVLSLKGGTGKTTTVRTLADVLRHAALGLLTINGLVAADWALISSEAQYFALQGVQGALEVIEQAREFYNPDLEWLGVVMNIADMRTVHSRDAYAQLKEHFGDKVFQT